MTLRAAQCTGFQTVVFIKVHIAPPVSVAHHNRESVGYIDTTLHFFSSVSPLFVSGSTSTQKVSNY